MKAWGEAIKDRFGLINRFEKDLPGLDGSEVLKKHQLVRGELFQEELARYGLYDVQVVLIQAPAALLSKHRGIRERRSLTTIYEG